MSKSAAQDLQYSSQAACLRSLCQRASIKLGFKCSTDTSSLLPHVCLYISDVGANGLIFNFTNNAPGIYEIKGINYHDDGLLGAAVKFGHIAGAGAEARLRDVRRPAPSDQSNPGETLPGTVAGGSAPTTAGPGLFAYGDGQSESLVNIFELHNGKDFPDIIYALTEGILCITLEILNLETHSHMRCINDASPMIG
jgi:hypothetical protein